ncbi:MAG: DNA polymerase III subunit delta' [Acidiferrobacterales bacterium]|nr:DNA polymerase III subunit delta' [Acidiferrobacterales bacterium]
MTSITQSLPWLNDSWTKLTRQLERTPHALLFTGQPGLGKNRLAIEFAHLLLCMNPDGDTPCGSCKSCQLFAATNHPDMKVVTPLEQGKSIGIDQIRELNRYLTLTPHTSARKVVLISPAEEMTTAAANSLLKQLEEPPLGSVLILISHHPHRLPATIRSRCARIDFRAPGPEEATQWLAEHGATTGVTAALAASGNAPLAAQALLEQGFVEERDKFLIDLLSLTRDGNPISCAERWQKSGSETALAWLQGFLLDVLKASLHAASNKGEPVDWSNPDALNAIQTIAAQVPAKQTAELLEVVNEGRRLLTTQIDERLLIEDILIRWNRVVA